MSPFLTEFTLVFTLQFVALIMPGPDNILVMSNAALHSRKHGIYTGLGISLGVIIQVTACLFGLGFVIKESPWLFNLITYISAIYLAYLGGKILYNFWYKMISPGAALQKSVTHYYQALLQGILCNLLNPKAFLFFLGLFTLVINEHTPIGWQTLYALSMVLSAFGWFTFVSIVITHPKGKYYMEKVQHILQPLFGILLIGYAVIIIWTL